MNCFLIQYRWIIIWKNIKSLNKKSVDLALAKFATAKFPIPLKAGRSLIVEQKLIKPNIGMCRVEE